MAAITTISPTILQKVWGTPLEDSMFLSMSKSIAGETVPRGATTVRIPLWFIQHAMALAPFQVDNPVGSENKIPRMYMNFETVDFPLKRKAVSMPLDIDLKTLINNPTYFPPSMVENMLVTMRWQAQLQHEADLFGNVMTAGNWTVDGLNYTSAGTAAQWDVAPLGVSTYNPFTDPVSGLLTWLRWMRAHMRRPNVVWIPEQLFYILTDNTRAKADIFPGVTVGTLPDITTDLVAKHLSNRMGYPITVELIRSQYVAKPGVPGAVSGAATELWTDQVIFGCASQTSMGRNDLFYRAEGWEGTEDREVFDEMTALRVYWKDQRIFTPSYSFGYLLTDCAAAL